VYKDNQHNKNQLKAELACINIQSLLHLIPRHVSNRTTMFYNYSEIEWLAW